MSRSFDITRRRRPAPPKPSSPPPLAPRRRRRSSGAWLILLFLAAIVAIIYYSQPSLTKQSSSNKTTINPNTNTNSTSPSPTTAQSSSAKPTKNLENGQPKIQILNGTGIESVTQKVKTTLTDNGYQVANSGQAQYEYAQTHIYYRPDSVEAAKAISGLMSTYKPELSESQIAGLFDILIIIGKNNLPQ